MGNDMTKFTRDPLCLDSQSGRYFMATVQQIREAEYQVNKEVIKEKLAKVQLRDNVDFGIYDNAYSCEPSIILDFNVDAYSRHKAYQAPHGLTEEEINFLIQDMQN